MGRFYNSLSQKPLTPSQLRNKIIMLDSMNSLAILNLDFYSAVNTGNLTSETMLSIA